MHKDVNCISGALDGGQLRRSDKHDMLRLVEEGQRRVGDGDSQVHDDIAEGLSKDADGSRHQVCCYLVRLLGP